MWVIFAVSGCASSPASILPAAGYNSNRQSLQRMMVPGGYSKSVSPQRMKPAFRQTSDLPLLVLTHLLTTALDDRGREQTEECNEQDGSEPVDVAGRL